MDTWDDFLSAPDLSPEARKRAEIELLKRSEGTDNRDAYVEVPRSFEIRLPPITAHIMKSQSKAGALSNLGLSRKTSQASFHSSHVSNQVTEEALSKAKDNEHSPSSSHPPAPVPTEQTSASARDSDDDSFLNRPATLSTARATMLYSIMNMSFFSDKFDGHQSASVSGNAAAPATSEVKPDLRDRTFHKLLDKLKTHGIRRKNRASESERLSVAMADEAEPGIPGKKVTARLRQRLHRGIVTVTPAKEKQRLYYVPETNERARRRAEKEAARHDNEQQHQSGHHGSMDDDSTHSRVALCFCL